MTDAQGVSMLCMHMDDRFASSARNCHVDLYHHILSRPARNLSHPSRDLSRSAASAEEQSSTLTSTWRILLSKRISCKILKSCEDGLGVGETEES
ncbi:hypothetical protein CLOM_g19022 [Closterium sp. NIES-68]|nr:hypothetical protein CLOM_g19022 [Closterium sp. NIES-68]GJP65905.1 hypothetical protein CLOP_g22806 [Closterium sp. NIES-67]